MSEIKFEQEELAKIAELQSTYQKLGAQLLQLRSAKIDAQDYLQSLTNEESRLDEELLQAKEKERALVGELDSKYGKGELNLETGIFTPIS